MKSLIAKIRESKILKILFVLGVSLGFILYHFRAVEFNTVWEELREAQINWLIAGMFVMCAFWFLESLVLYKLSKKAPRKQTLWQSIKTAMVGQFFNTITPFASGGQPAELYIMGKNGISIGVGSSILLIKFIIFQAMLVLSSIFVLLYGYEYLQNETVPHLNTMIISGFTFNFLVIFTLITIAKSKRVAFFIAYALLKPFSFLIKEERYTRWKKKIDQKLITFHKEMNGMNVDWGLLFQCIVLTLIQLWLFFSIPYFILQGLGIVHVDIFQVIAYHAFVMMFSSLIPIPGGSGGAEYSFSLLFGLILTPSVLVIVVFFWRLITYYSSTIVGSFFLFMTGRKTE